MRSYPIAFLKLFIVMLLFLSIPVMNAQEPPHPPTVGHGVKGNQSPGNAPVGGGTEIFLLLAAAYAVTRKGKSNFRPDEEPAD
jgi:hypothetical protein